MRIPSLLIQTLVVLAIAATGLALLATDDKPAPASHYPLSRTDIERAERLLREHDPRHQKNGAIRHLLLRQRDLNVALNYLLTGARRGSAQLRLQAGRLDADLSLRLPAPFSHRWLNLTARFTEGAPLPRLEALRIGALQIPDALVPTIASLLEQWLKQDPRSAPLLGTVQQIRFIDRRLYARYRWQAGSLAGVRATLLGELDPDSLAAYHRALIDTTRHFPAGASVPLPKLLRPLFALARKRSRKRDPVDENRALLAVLAAWAGGRGLSALAADSDARPRRLRPTLRARHDLAQHLLISAALALGSDRGMANAIGLYKEIRDSWRGSGFSFTDLAADMAGARLGENATASAANARRIQHLLANGISEDQLLPAIEDLPENLSARDFSLRFDDTHSVEYHRLLKRIKNRLNRSPLLAK